MVLGVWQLQSEQSVQHVDNDSYYVNCAVDQRRAWQYWELGVWQLQSEQSVLHVDNDSNYVNSAVNQRGARWYVECSNSNLNRVYYMLTMTAIMSTVL